MSDRKEFQSAREAGKAIHQAQRLENATYTAVEVKALTKTAADLAYALGRKETAEEIAWALEECADDLTPPITTEWLELRDWFKGQLHEVAAKAREIGTKENS